MNGSATTGQAPSLAEEDFPAFFGEVHGWEPFPWQTALLHRVLKQGWPALIDIPTGLGKTAVLDVAVFANALGSHCARRRVFFIVDRRLIVDQAHDHAIQIQEALRTSGLGTACHAVAQRLSAAGDDGPVLDVTRMRGGVTWSWLWLERPDRHAIVTGTVDQVGSRLLFRGYGVGERLRPIDAALTGTDSLIIVDEAHLSDVFMSTLRDVQRLETASTSPAPVVVAMSASPGESADTHRISAADEQHPVAGKRLTAPKRLHLVTLPAGKDTAEEAMADALASRALRLGGPGRVTGVVANTVAMARAVFGKLQAELGAAPGPGESPCVLLTGRIRPVDREYLLGTWYPRIRASSEYQGMEPLYVVATQTIEVGADIDLHALVTESASLPALIQRLGRVNRRGTRGQATAVVVHSDHLADGIYGPARQHTWQWLSGLITPVKHRSGRPGGDLGQGRDASPLALRARMRGLGAAEREAMRGLSPYAPLVSAVTLDTWARTSPIPHPDIPVAPYLHGIESGEPTISLIWRADLHGDDPQEWSRSAERLPPSSDEAIELPVSAARRWLAAPGLVPAVSDVESQASSRQDKGGRVLDSGGTRQVLRYRGPGNTDPVAAHQVRAGDVIIVPASWGGCDRYGWNPSSIEPVTDVADLTGGAWRRVTAVRIGSVLTRAISAVAPGMQALVEQLVGQIRADIDADAPDSAAYRSRVGEIVAGFPGGDSSALPHERILRRLAGSGQLTVLDEGAAGDGVVALFAAAGASWNEDTSAAGSSASSSARPITLAAHQAAVRKRAQQFAGNLGLPRHLARSVALASVLHDEGKRDPRFQVMLHGGDRWRAQAASQPLAKSGMDPADRATFQLAHQLSGYPIGMRHEALSARIAALLIQHGEGREEPAVDQDLVIHLVASHHGYGRPLLPPITDPAPLTVEVPVNGATAAVGTADTVDWEGPGRFALLCERYGYWGLALLETVVRLADIWCSARSEGSS